MPGAHSYAVNSRSFSSGLGVTRMKMEFIVLSQVSAINSDWARYTHAQLAYCALKGVRHSFRQHRDSPARGLQPKRDGRAYQLGGKKAFARVKADDENATSPGDVLRELFKEYGPCLILIDEWVAYVRQLHDQSDLPAGGFETQFSFAQALTESAKLAGNCLLVISLPASDTAGSPHTQADDVEVGGVRGREALNRLRNVVGRVESSWRPATAEDGFEIVRRRLFEPIPGDQFKNRDVTARAFSDLYHSQGAEFPPDCRDHDYLKRIQAAYPIHPEIFDQLYVCGARS